MSDKGEPIHSVALPSGRYEYMSLTQAHELYKELFAIVGGHDVKEKLTPAQGLAPPARPVKKLDDSMAKYAEGRRVYNALTRQWQNEPLKYSDDGTYLIG